MREVYRHQAWIVLVASVVLLTRLGAPRLWDDDEPRNATCAAEMLARGDWVKPTFNDQLRTDKPILLYWFTIPLYQWFGVNEWSARLTSALFGIGTVLLTYHLGRRLFSAAAGFWGALLLSSSLWFVVASRVATPDSLLIFFSTLSIWLFVAGADDAVAAPKSIRGLPGKWWVYAAVYAAMAMAVLAKGPVGLLLPTAVLGLYLLLINQADASPAVVDAPSAPGLRGVVKRVAAWTLRTFWPSRIARYAWQMRPLTALAVVAVLALPWYVAVHLRTDGAWTEGFFWKHNVERFRAPMEGHQGPPFYHLLSIALGFFPASVFLAPMALHTWRRLKTDCPERRGYLLAISWIAVYIVVFSIAGTKLPNYVTPCYPALALLTGALLAQWIAHPAEVSRGWLLTALAVFGLAGVGLLIGLTIFARYFLPGERAVGLVGVIPIAGGAACLALALRGEARRTVTVFAASAAMFSLVFFTLSLPRANRFQEAVPIARLIESHSDGTPEVEAFKILRPSWVYYSRQSLGPLVRPEEAARLLREPGPRFLITDERSLDGLRDLLPTDVQVLGRFRRFLRSDYVVVLGRGKDSVEASASAARDFSRLRTSAVPSTFR